LFEDEELELDDEDGNTFELAGTETSLNVDQQQALRVLASHLLELRRMLRMPPGNL
jgi:hypothetical protein